MSNTSKISRSLIAALITVCMLMSLVPGGVVSATGEEATQYGIFNFDNSTGTGELREAVSGTGLSGVFVQGPGSVDASDLPGLIVANNATILNGDAATYSRTSLLGDSSIKIEGYTLSSNMPEFTGAIDLEGENAGTEVFDSIFTHIMTHVADEKLTVSILSNKTVNSDTNFCVVEENPTGAFIDTFEIGKNTKLTLASTVFMQVNDLVINEGGSIELGADSTLEISGNSPLGLGGYITAAEGAHIIVGEYHMVYTNGQWEQFNNPNDFKGIQVRFDDNYITKIQYALDNGSFADVPGDNVIPMDSLGNCSKITFKAVPKQNEENRNYVLEYVDNPDFEHEENWQRTRIDHNDGSDGITFNLEKSAISSDKFVVDIFPDDGGPNNDFEGIQVRYDLGRVSKVQYAIDNGTFQDVPDDQIIPKSEISNCTTIKFKAIPKEGEENREFILEYVDDPDFDDEENWIRSSIERDEGTEIVFTVSKSLIQSDKFVVDIVTVGGFDPNYKGINVGYDDNIISNVQYSVDNGTFQDLPTDHIIPADTVNSCTTNIRFKIVPQTNEENRNYVLDYVDGPDYTVGNETWVWNRITHDEGENYIFTVSKSLITKDQFDINIFADDGVNPPSESFSIETKITAGRGNIAISPETVIIGDGCLGDDHMRYDIAYDDYDDVSVVITPHTDDVVSYAVKSISVSGIGENDYEIANNVLTLKNRPGDNTTIVITVEFEIPNSYILNDVAERGYAYTIITSNYSNPQDIIDDAKAYLTTELWNYYFDNGRIYSGIYSSKSDLADSITKYALSPALPDNDINNPIDILDIEYCPYIDFKLAVDADNSIVLRVYLLQKLGFYIKTPKADNSGYDYYFAEYKQNDQGFADDIVLVYDHDVGSAQIFGNGVDMEGVILSDSHDVFSGHVHQERTQLFNRDDANYISVRVVIVNIPNSLATTAVRVSGNRSCPGWEFDRMNIYTASANRGNATDAYIYIGSTSVELDAVVFGNNSDISDTITAVEIDSSYGLSGNIIKVTQNGGKFIVSFLDSNNQMTTNYDFIPLRLSIKDKNNQTTFKYLNLHRVALRIDKYNDGDTAALKGTYYYSTLKTAPSADDRVDLYVTVTKSDGSKETILIDGSSVQVKRSDDQEDNPNFNPYYSEFTIWSGSESDLDQIVKVEVIAISRANNTDTHFGGIKVGFNSGVVWVKG